MLSYLCFFQDLNVDLDDEQLIFQATGLGVQGYKNYGLHVEFYLPIDPDVRILTFYIQVIVITTMLSLVSNALTLLPVHKRHFFNFKSIYMFFRMLKNLWKILFFHY